MCKSLVVQLINLGKSKIHLCPVERYPAYMMTSDRIKLEEEKHVWYSPV